MWIWFESIFKNFRVQIEILVAIFNWISHCLCQIDIAISWGWWIYRTTMGNWHQMSNWFEDGFKDFTVQIQLFAVILIKFPSNNWICWCFCHIDIAENWGWRIYRATTGEWRQIKKIYNSNQILLEPFFSDFWNSK